MAKSPALVSERKQPGTFCLSLGMRRSRSAGLLSPGTRRSVRKCRTSLRRSRSRRAGTGCRSRAGWFHR